MLKDELNISHLSVHQQCLACCYYGILESFLQRGRYHPVKDDEYKIDTGNAAPVRCRNPTFGPHETPVIARQRNYLLRAQEMLALLPIFTPRT